MKRYLIVLIILCGFFNRVCGQSATAAIDSLIKYKVITVKERPMVERELKNKGIASYRVAILGGLESVILQKTFHVDPHKTPTFISYRNTHLIEKNQDSINTSLRFLLQKINKAGLLTDRVYTYALNGIDSSRYMIDLQLISSLTEMSSRLEWLAPNKLLPVAEELHKNGIVNDSSFLRLQDDIRSNKIESVYQLAGYCSLERTLDMTKYADDPDIWLEQLHRDIASILPGLNFTDFSYTTITDTSLSIGNIPGIKFRVSLKCNGQIYKYTSVTINRRKNEAKVSPKDIYIQNFYRIFNKILTDQQSPFRLHDIMFSRPEGHLRQVALIALRDTQTRVFMQYPCMSYMLVSMENYDNTLTSSRIDSAIAEWREIGVFAHLSNAEIIKATDDAEADDLFSINNLLADFPGVIYPLSPMLVSPQYSYSNILTHLAGITHGLFKPTHIKQKKIHGGFTLQYQFKGKLHSFTFKNKYGWLDERFPAFIKGLGQENDLPGNFYQLPDLEAAVYLTRQQYDYAVKHDLLYFWDGNKHIVQ